MPAGRPLHFKTPEELESKWDEFYQHCQENNKWMTKDYFCVKYGYYTDLFNTYAKKPEFSGILYKVDKQCKHSLLEKGLNNEFNPQIVKLIATADYGMSDKVVQENTNHNMNAELTPKQLKEEIRQARLEKNGKNS